MKQPVLLLLFTVVLAAACTKNLLDEKPTNELIIPDSAEACWKLLDNDKEMDLTPPMAEASADDYFFTNTYYEGRSPLEKNVYRWSKDLYEDAGKIADWNRPYRQVFICNLVLETLAAIAPNIPASQYNALQATALFKRSFAFFQLSQLFVPPYQPAQAHLPWGIPLKLASAIDQSTLRSTVQETYTQILNDLQQAAALHAVSAQPDIRRNRPCQAAIYALLSRVYLTMRLYPQAGAYADSSLQQYAALINYNNGISTGTNTPFGAINAENLYTSKTDINVFQCILPVSGQAYIDTVLLRQYQEYDLRRKIFFTSGTTTVRRKNFYDGTSPSLYTGLATDEVYLNRAECLAREGATEKAMEYLNRLLEARYATGHFTALQATDAATALQIILTERRKELVMRGIRWSDLRRLTATDTTLVPARLINGTRYTLLPGSNTYILPIPPDVIKASGIAQHER